MILSNRHKYIFVNCRKTAGSSICVALSNSLGPTDLQLGGIIETLEAGGALSERTLSEARKSSVGLALKTPFVSREKLKRSISRALKRRYKGRLGSKPPHAPAARIAETFPDEWANYRKFCVVRNPWDKTVSDYFWRTNNVETPPPFTEYVEALAAGDSLGGIVPLLIHSNWEIYTIDDRLAVDHVVRYENLDADLSKVCGGLGVPWDGLWTRAKGAHRKVSGHKDLYTAETRDMIGTLYRKEIDMFGYEF